MNFLGRALPPALYGLAGRERPLPITGYYRLSELPDGSMLLEPGDLMPPLWDELVLPEPDDPMLPDEAGAIWSSFSTLFTPVICCTLEAI